MKPEEIKKLRERSGLSTEEFAEYLGVSKNAIYNLETNRNIPSPNVRKKMRKLLEKLNEEKSLAEQEIEIKETEESKSEIKKDFEPLVRITRHTGYNIIERAPSQKEFKG